MLKKLFITFVIALFLGAGWVFNEYRKATGEANAQVEKDLHDLRIAYDLQQETKTGIFANAENFQKSFLDRQLVNQTINEQQQFVRHYHGLYILEGKKSCLKTQVIYLNRRMEIFKETWVDGDFGCLP